MMRHHEMDGARCIPAEDPAQTQRRLSKYKRRMRTIEEVNKNGMGGECAQRATLIEAQEGIDQQVRKVIGKIGNERRASTSLLPIFFVR